MLILHKMILWKVEYFNSDKAYLATQKKSDKAY